MALKPFQHSVHPTFSQHPFNFCWTNVGQILNPFKWAFSWKLISSAFPLKCFLFSIQSTASHQIIMADGCLRYAAMSPMCLGRRLISTLPSPPPRYCQDTNSLHFTILYYECWYWAWLLLTTVWSSTWLHLLHASLYKEWNFLSWSLVIPSAFMSALSPNTDQQEISTQSTALLKTKNLPTCRNF